jgi:hypothetical protein
MIVTLGGMTGWHAPRKMIVASASKRANFIMVIITCVVLKALHYYSV